MDLQTYVYVLAAYFLTYSKKIFRNYDILAAVFSDIVKFMHDDFGLAFENDTQEANRG